MAEPSVPAAADEHGPIRRLRLERPCPYRACRASSKPGILRASTPLYSAYGR